jgi:hypothetical protein
MPESSKLPVLKLFSWILILSAIIISCATPVGPTGGEKDEVPPIVVEYEPQNYTVNFDGDEIIITFNEFVELKDISQKLMVSPPMDDKPEVDTRGKSVVIDIIDTLLPNTTYSFYFADAIVDLHEGNPIENFEFVFSTGPVLDSMQISGRLVDAYTQKPVKDAFVMLYKDNADSVPIKQIPFYLSKTSEDGSFSLSNLAMMKYKLFALKDANSNYLFDLPNEKIAFSDTLITPFEVSSKNMFKTLDTTSTDTIAKDSLNVKQDTTVLAAPPHDSLILRFFKERDTTLKLTTSIIEKNKYVALGFNKPVDSVKVKALKPQWDNEWNITEWFEEKDSLLLWLKDFSSDSLVIDVAADTSLRDTLTFTYFKKENKNKKPSDEESNRLTLKAQLDGSTQLLRHPLEIQFNHPVLNTFNADSLDLYSSEDTVRVGFEKYHLRKMRINHSWKEGMNYQLLIPDSTFTSIYGVGNDSTMVRFNTKTLKDYGTFILNVKTDSTQPGVSYFIQLLSQDEKQIFDAFSTTKDTTLTFNLLSPGKYKLKGIVDRNRNKRWDSGIYLKKEQPEKVFYYQGEIEIIGNWEVDYDWKIKP